MSDPTRDADPRNVLVVDDDAAVRELLADGLETFGYPSVTAGGIDEAFEIVKAEPLRLVLSDIDMPGGDGMQLLKRIKSHDPGLDVIMVTGAVDADTAVQAIRQGASDYVTKPFNLDEVQIVVERTLEKRRLILENKAHQDHLEELVTQRTRELVEKKREVEKLFTELEETYESTLQALVTALDLRDNETHGHSYRVVEYAVVVAERMGVTEPQLSCASPTSSPRTSGARCGATRRWATRCSSTSRFSSPRSTSSCTTRSATTAWATRKASAETRFRWGRGSSPWWTPSTR
jgi:response regulator RpfG family c-di-GMP phosphodiesterase